ncbi:MAG: ABC transporter ATP-binding protein [Verrucomicrobiota bacterium]
MELDTVAELGQLEYGPEAVAAIEVEGLVRHFGNLRAVDDVSFKVEAGKVVGFIGANGAGKTTTMRILSTLETADAGRIRVMGYDVISQPAEVRKVLGWMPDAFGKYKNMEVEEYLDFFARAYGLKGELREKRLNDVSEFTELNRISRMPVATLSKGQSQRLSLARTLLNDPEVLILDEPAAGLDPKARVELKNLIRLLARKGKTLLISSHILSELDEVCDALVFIDRGKIVFHGDSHQLKNDSQGEMLVEVQVSGGDEAFMAWLHSHASLELDKQAEGHFFVKLKGEGDRRAQVLREIVEAGFDVIGFKKTERKLEEAFIKHLKENEGH